MAVVLINFDNDEDTIECLESLTEQSTDDFLTIVVDNGSDQDSFENVTERFSFPVYLRNENNLGFTGGNNRGIEYALDAGVDYVFLLNNDTVVESTLIEELISAAEDAPPEVGIMGPTVHTHEKKEVWAKGGHLNRWTGSTTHRTAAEPSTEANPVDYVVGAALLVRSRVFQEIGLLDEDFFIYYGETEFCRRANRHGWHVWHIPVEGIYHKETTKFQHSAFRDYYFTRNRFLFMRKTQPLHVVVVFLASYLCRWLIAQSIYLTITGNVSAARATLKGGADALRYRTGREN